MDLSTQRSMAPGSFQILTPAARSACSTPSLSVTASKLPPGTERTNAASGSRSSPGRRKAGDAAVSMAQCRSDRTAVRAPLAAKARARRRACQSSSPKIATRGPVRGSGERGIEQFGVDPAADMAAPAVEAGHDRGSGAEEHRIDGVEVAAHTGEDVGEGRAVIARAEAR